METMDGVDKVDVVDQVAALRGQLKAVTQLSDIQADVAQVHVLKLEKALVDALAERDALQLTVDSGQWTAGKEASFGESEWRAITERAERERDAALAKLAVYESEAPSAYVDVEEMAKVFRLAYDGDEADTASVSERMRRGLKAALDEVGVRATAYWHKALRHEGHTAAEWHGVAVAAQEAANNIMKGEEGRVKGEGGAVEELLELFRRSSDHGEWHESWVKAKDPAVVADTHNALYRDFLAHSKLAIEFACKKFGARVAELQASVAREQSARVRAERDVAALEGKLLKGEAGSEKSEAGRVKELEAALAALKQAHQAEKDDLRRNHAGEVAGLQSMVKEFQKKVLPTDNTDGVDKVDEVDSVDGNATSERVRVTGTDHLGNVVSEEIDAPVYDHSGLPADILAGKDA